MAEHPAVEKPLLTFPEHSAATKLAVSPAGFGDKGDMFLAFFGHMAPMTGTVEGEHGGHRVVRINPDTKKVETFFSKKESHAHESHAHEKTTGTAGKEPKKAQSEGHDRQEESLTPGPRRLVDVAFSPDGQAMYIVDFGAMVVEKEPKPFPGSGVVWRITRDGTKVNGPPANLSVKQVKGGAQ
jgi:hypothetical protein